MKVGRSIKRGAKWLVQFNELDFFPARHTFRGYNQAGLAGDLRAGTNIALLAFPQAMAYALIAGLPIQYGLYCFIAASFFAPFFASSRYNSYGPSNATSVLLLSSFLTLQFPPEKMLLAVPLMVLMAGVFLMFAAYFKIGRLIQYVSRTVITGYITAAALLIVANQIRNVLGYDIAPTASFIGIIYETAAGLAKTHWPSLAVGLITWGIYLLLNNRLPKLPNVALTLLLATVISVTMAQYGIVVDTLDDIVLSDFTLAPYVFSMDLITQLASASLALALLISLEACSIGKSLAARSGDRLKVNQELFALGFANIGSSFFGGMPASASLTRSTLAFKSDAHSSLGNIFAGLIVAALLLTLGGFIGSIPKPALAVLVIIIGISLISWKLIRLVSRATRSDAAVFYVTLISGLFLALDTAIYLGTVLSIVLFLRKVAEPEMVEYSFNDEGVLAEMQNPKQRNLPEVSIVHVEGELFFGAAEIFYEQMRRVCDDDNLKIVILKMRNAHHLDATAVLALSELIRYMKDNDRMILFSEVRKDVIRIFRNSGLMDVAGRDFVIPDNPSNPTKSTSSALRKAMVLLKGEEADVKIYLGTAKKKTNKEKDS